MPSMTSRFARSILTIILLHFRVPDVNIGSFFEYEKLIHEIYRKIFSCLKKKEWAFISYNLSETWEGRLLGRGIYQRKYSMCKVKLEYEVMLY